MSTAPLTGADGSLTAQDGRPVQTDAAEHATDMTNSGLWSLFDQDEKDLQQTTELQVNTPEGQIVTLKITTHHYREIFLRQYANGTIIVPPELVNGQNGTAKYDMVWNILLFKTKNKRYPMVRVTQTTFMNRSDVDTTAGTPSANLTDINVQPPPKYNQTDLLNATQAADYEDFATKPLTDMIAETSGGAINGTVNSRRRRQRRRQRRGLR